MFSLLYPSFFPSFLSARLTSSVSFDFIVIGGGTAGLVVAQGLASTIPNASVALVEAGEHLVTNITLIPETFEHFIGTPVDWNFTSIPQVHAGNRQISSPRGKLLGSTGIVNGMFYVKSHKAEYDAWETLGNTGWNFTTIDAHIKAIENYTPASPHDAHTFAANDMASDHGSHGPVDVTYSTYWDPQPLTPAFISSMAVLGVNTIRHASGGFPAGVWSTPYAVKPVNRSHAFYGEDLVVSGIVGLNLHLLTGAEVTKLQLSTNAKSGDVLAMGVEYVRNGETQLLKVRGGGRVVLTAGTFQTPKILEFSGIGNATLLKQHGITPQVNLPYVGENLQDHTDVVVSFELKPGLGTSVEDLTRNATFAAEQLALYLNNRTGAYGSIPSSTVAMLPVQSFINATRLKELIAKLDESLKIHKGTPMEKQIAVQRILLDNPTVPDIELVLLPGAAEAGGSTNPNASHMAIAAVTMHPFSRGNVHLNSSDPLNLARLDPQPLGSGFETDTLVESIKFIERLSKTAPLSGLIAKQITPSPGLSDSPLTDFVRNTAFSSWHPAGPTSMLPRDQGGVVDHNLKVYGTENIYVADASVIPLSLGTHTMDTIYGIAHKAVEILST